MGKLIQQLYQGAVHGDTKAIDDAIARGVDLEAKTRGLTALHQAVQSLSLKGVRHMIERGANLDTLDSEGSTPLMSACLQGGVKGSKIALLLMEKGADINVRREDEMSALDFAAHHATPEVVEALLERGAPVNGPKGCLQTPAMHATRGGNVKTLQTLIDHGADVSIPNRLPWAKGGDCLAIAKMENRRSVVKFLEGLAA